MYVSTVAPIRQPLRGYVPLRHWCSLEGLHGNTPLTLCLSWKMTCTWCACPLVNQPGKRWNGEAASWEIIVWLWENIIWIMGSGFPHWVRNALWGSSLFEGKKTGIGIFDIPLVTTGDLWTKSFGSPDFSELRGRHVSVLQRLVPRTWWTICRICSLMRLPVWGKQP